MGSMNRQVNVLENGWKHGQSQQSVIKQWIIQPLIFKSIKTVSDILTVYQWMNQ